MTDGPREGRRSQGVAVPRGEAPVAVWQCRTCGRVITAPAVRAFQPNTICQCARPYTAMTRLVHG